MQSRDFCYWLQGALELGRVKELDAEQTDILRKHLNMVFVHEIDPSMGDERHQAEVRAAHEGGPRPRPAPAPAPSVGGGRTVFDPHTTKIMC